MDKPAEHLTPEEVDCLNGISADFYTLAATPAPRQPAPADLQARRQEVSNGHHVQDFVRELDMVRKNEPYLAPVVVANYRGRFWSDAGEKEIAADFFEKAKELARQNGQPINEPSCLPP